MTEYHDPSKIALGIGSDQALCGTVVIETLDGEEYVFPNMNVTALKAVLPESGRRPESMPNLVMVNASVSTLMVPFRIIRRITVGAEVLWNDKRSARP